VRARNARLPGERAGRKTLPAEPEEERAANDAEGHLDHGEHAGKGGKAEGRECRITGVGNGCAEPPGNTGDKATLQRSADAKGTDGAQRRGDGEPQKHAFGEEE